MREVRRGAQRAAVEDSVTRGPPTSSRDKKRATEVWLSPMLSRQSEINFEIMFMLDPCNDLLDIK